MSMHTVEQIEQIEQVSRRTAPPRTQPRRLPTAVPAAVVVALVLVGVAVVSVRDLVVSQGWTAGSQVAPALIDALDGVRPSVGLSVAGGGLALIGLVVAWLALRPGQRTHLAVAGGTDLWLAPDAVVALAREVADRSPGVVSSEASRASRRRINVDIVVAERMTADDGPHVAVTEKVRAVLDDEVGRLTRVGFTVRATEVPR